MKFIRKGLPALVVWVLAGSLVLPPIGSVRGVALAQTASDSVAQEHVETAGKIAINQKSIDDFILSGNTDITRAIYSMNKARDAVSIARTELLPSIQLGFIFAKADPFFMLNMASCLVPFLFPSRWYDLAAAKNSHLSEWVGLEIAQMNALAMGRTLLSRVAGDQAVLEVFRGQHAKLKNYVEGIRQLNQMGLVSRADLLKGEIELGRLEIDLSKTTAMVVQEKAALRKMLALPLDVELEFAFEDSTPSSFEAAHPNQLLSVAYDQAPELLQIEYLTTAARKKVRSMQWAFLGGCSGTSVQVGSGAIGENAFLLSTGASVNLGFGYFPRVKLAKRAYQDMDLKRQELRLEIARVLESTLWSIATLKERLATTEKNLIAAEELLVEQNQLFELGRSSVREILDTFAWISALKVEAVAGKIGMEGHRITLKRMTFKEFGFDRHTSLVDAPVRLGKARTDVGVVSDQE